MATAAPLSASMPQFTNLSYGTTVTLEALDPTSGAAVTGVVFDAVEIWADVGEIGGGTQNTSGPFMLVPGPNA